MPDKITLNNIVAVANTSLINDNFTSIAAALNSEVLYRDNPVGTTNTMQDSLDMNSNQVINLTDPTTAQGAATKAYVDGLASFANAATLQAAVASTAADVLLTAADVVLTNADVVLTHADVVLTAADAVSTAADAVSTAADLTAFLASPAFTGTPTAPTAATTTNTTQVATTAFVKQEIDAIPAASASVVVQTVSATPLTAYTTITAAAFFDDTIPQSSESTEILTLSITPTSATNKIRLRYDGAIAGSTAINVLISFHQDGGASAIHGKWITTPATNFATDVTGVFEMVSGTTSSTTFTVRVGRVTSGTLYLNGDLSARKMGGISQHNFIAEEITV